MSEVMEMFKVGPGDCIRRTVTHTNESFHEAVDEICAGLISAGVRDGEVVLNWFPNAPSPKTEIVVNGVCKYEVVKYCPYRQ